MASVATELPHRREYLYYRHALPVRVMHWINVVTLAILLMSGLADLQCASGAVLGQVVVHRCSPPVLAIAIEDRGAAGMEGVTRIFGRTFVTTGVLGLSTNREGAPARVLSRGG